MTDRNYCREKGIELSKIAGLGSDGASVMVGKQNGVGARLRKLNPYMLSMHCVAHKLALASEAAASSVPYCKQHRSILKGIYNYFHTSPTHYSVLRDIMDLLNDPEVQIQQVHSVRWLTMHRAVEAIRKCYHSLLSTLSTLVVENDDIVAGGLYRSVCSYKFIVFTHFLCDILGQLTYLSCFFQQDNLDFSQVKSAVDGTISTIKEDYIDCEIVGGEHLNSILIELDNPILFEDHNVIKSSSDEHECFTSIRNFTEAVVQNLEDRFPDLPIWSAFKILDPQSYPSKATSLRDFGKKEVITIVDHFCTPKFGDGIEYDEIIDQALFQREWPVFKRSVYDNYRSLSFKELAKEIITQKKASFPTISKLLKLIIVLPMSSVPCERGFSAHNRIRAKFRQQLVQKTVKSLMFISVNGPDPENFDFNEPLKLWKKKRNRLFYKHCGCLTVILS